MRVLITSAASPWPRELAASLSGSHDVRLTDRTEVSSDLEFVRSELGHEAPTNDLVKGMDAIVHTGDVDPAASVSDQLDFQMRCTYNLGEAMNVLILGANGMLGPHVIKAIEGKHRLRLTDINDMETEHEYIEPDVSDLNQVVAAAEGMDAIINCSVLRLDRKLAFDVSARGCYNMMTAAVRHGVRRVINTGPMFTVAGPTYERFDHRIGPDIPPQPGTYLYAHTESLGQEICRVFTENHDIYVMGLLFYMFISPDDRAYSPGGSPQPIGEDFTPYTVSWRDAGTSFTCALDIELDKLPSRCEQFFISADLPHGKWSNEKTKRILGWQPKDRLEEFWHKVRG